MKNITTAVISLTILFVFTLTANSSAKTLVFQETKCSSKCNCCDNDKTVKMVCEPEYIIVWGKGEKGVEWFLKNHKANYSTYLGDVYKIPEENKVSTPGFFKIIDGKTAFLKSNKKGVTDKFYRFVSYKSAKLNTKNGEISIELPKNMPKGKYFLGIMSINGFSVSEPSDIKSFEIK